MDTQLSIPASPTQTQTEPEPAGHTRPRFQLIRQLVRTPSGAIGLAIVSLYVIVALVGAAGLTPYDPLEQHRTDRLQGPSREYWMGTDLLGRDLFSRIIKGGTNSLIVVLASVSLATAAGTTIGVFSAWSGGFVDNLAMRVMDVFFAFPAILLALLVVTILGSGLRNTVVAIAIVYTPIFARVARGPVLSLKESDFVEAATAMGSSSVRVLLRHVLPNTVAPTIVQVSLRCRGPC
ncbi:MAG: ABC transporter permease [Thermomicrobiales bacterium]